MKLANRHGNTSDQGSIDDSVPLSDSAQTSVRAQIPSPETKRPQKKRKTRASAKATTLSRKRIVALQKQTGQSEARLQWLHQAALERKMLFGDYTLYTETNTPLTVADILRSPEACKSNFARPNRTLPAILNARFRLRVGITACIGRHHCHRMPTPPAARASRQDPCRCHHGRDRRRHNARRVPRAA